MNLAARILLLFGFFIFVVTACKPSVPDSVLAQHEATYPAIRKKYVYQSLIRLANIKHDPNFEKLIRDVSKVVLYLPPREDSTYQIRDLRMNMRTGGYEELMDVRTADAQRISLWVRETDNIQHYLALVDTDTEDLILEIDGQLHLEYLNALNVADQKTLTDLIKGGF